MNEMELEKIELIKELKKKFTQHRYVYSEVVHEYIHAVYLLIDEELMLDIDGNGGRKDLNRTKLLGQIRLDHETITNNLKVMHQNLDYSSEDRDKIGDFLANHQGYNWIEHETIYSGLDAYNNFVLELC